jgi:serine/threonine protein kinase
MSNNRALLKSVQDLYSLAEVFRPEKGHPDRPYVFKSTIFSFIDDNGVAYFGELPIREKEISLELFHDNLEHIPDEEIYPPASSHITISAISVGNDVYIKEPNLVVYKTSKERGVLAKLLLQEVEVMELVKERPHPHIVHYHGCIVNRGRILSIVLDRYHQTLERRREDRGRGFNADLCFKSIRSAIKHLHSLGLAHNDLNPMNIMVDREDTPFLIDFGSCRPFGASLISTGTLGWMEDEFVTSEKSHDEFSLRKLQSWLVDMPAGNYERRSYPIPSLSKSSVAPDIA